MKRTRLRHWTAGALLLVLGGCGPATSYNVNVRGIPQNIALGQQVTPAPVPVPVPGANLEPGVPGFLVPPPPVGHLPAVPAKTPLPTPVPACPSADLFATVDPEATTDFSAAPKPGVYHYRQNEVYTANGRTLVIAPPTVDITVGPSYVGQILANSQHDPSDKSIYWTQSETSLTPNGAKAATVTYTFRLIAPDPTATPAVAGEVDIYKIVIEHADASTDAFQPTGTTDGFQAQYLVFPAMSRPEWSDSAIDTLHQTEFVDQAGIDGRNDPVDACGTLVDSIRVDMGPIYPGLKESEAGKTVQLTPDSKGQASFTYEASSTLNYNIDGWYDIATQYNGLLVAENITETGTGWKLTRTLTINSVTPTPLNAHS